MAKLTAAKRNKLSSSTFALPGERKFPISDRSHAVNALSRASQSSIEGVKAKVRAAVHRKFPDLPKD